MPRDAMADAEQSGVALQIVTLDKAENRIEVNERSLDILDANIRVACEGRGWRFRAASP